MSPRRDANTMTGRTLLALRAGSMTSGEIDERFGRMPPLSTMVAQGLITGDCDGWRITDAGRAACPLRNPLAETIVAAPTAPPLGINRRSLPIEPLHRQIANFSGGIEMPRNTDKTGAVDKVRAVLDGHPNGVSRKEIIRTTSLSATSVDNAIFNLIKCGDAMRQGYGVIVLTSAFQRVEAAVMPIVTPAPASEKATEPLQKPQPQERPTPEMKFSLYDDGRLAIMGGDDILVLPPDATRRLGHFLGCFDMKQTLQLSAV